MDPSLAQAQELPMDAMSGAEALMQTPLRRYFEAAVKYEASDLIMRGGQSPRVRIRTRLQPLKGPPIEPDEFDRLIGESLSEYAKDQIRRYGSLDVGMSLDERHRFRVNIFRTRGRFAFAARRVNDRIGSFAELHLPASLAKIAEAEQGLVLAGGVTASGKTTTIASMIQHLNQHRPCHIVTIEDPIEYLFVEDKAIIHQRELGIDVPTTAVALRALVRENPDVVMIGEMRDRETFEAALQAAETGHLVFGTIHASTTSQMFSRIYDLFPGDQHGVIRNLLATQLRAFLCQKLLPTIRDDVEQVPAMEILLQSPPTKKYILDGREVELDQVIKQQREAGMCCMVDSLVELVEKEYIHPKVAEAAAPSAEELHMRLRGIVADHG